MSANENKTLHSVHNMNYHLVLVTKYRRQVITDDISNELKDIFTKTGKTQHVKIKEWNHDKDHIHVLITATPTTSIPKLVNAYKSASSRIIKRDHPEIKQQLWKEYFWSRSYYVATCGGVTIDTLKKYIQTQGEND